MNASFDFTGHTLVLTGAAGGIGRCIAELFHRSGANLVLGDRDEAALNALANDLGEGRIATLAGTPPARRTRRRWSIWPPRALAGSTFSSPARASTPRSPLPR